MALQTSTRITVQLLKAAAEAAFRTLPHGGDDVAIRNAWAAMSADATRARERRAVEAFLAAVESDHPAVGRSR